MLQRSRIWVTRMTSGGPARLQRAGSASAGAPPRPSPVTAPIPRREGFRGGPVHAARHCEETQLTALGATARLAESNPLEPHRSAVCA